jgi:hypothetical protein
MDSRVNEIIIGLQRLLKSVENSFIAKVVEDKKDTVDVDDLNGARYPDVRKIATQGQQGVIFKLKKDSFVIVSRISGSDELFVSMMSEIEKIEIAVDEIVINEGRNDGLVKIHKLEQNLENIKTYLNTLNAAIATGLGSTVSNGGVAAATAFTTTMQGAPITFENMENDKIKH